MRFFITFLVLASPCAIGQSADTLARIDQLFTRWHNGTPGGVVTISQDDNFIYHKAFGMADLEHNVPNTTGTIFESGSIAKQFTAMSILLLAKEGKLSLQDEVHKYIPELPKYDAPITIRHLLNHTSGLKDWGFIGGLAGWPRTTRVYTQELALQIMSRQRSLNFTPGSEYAYSNGNYTPLVTIVERVSGMSLSAFTFLRLFGPLQMNNTKWRNNFREVIPNRAIAYSKSDAEYLQNMPFENIHGHGGLLTTTSDLIIWNRLLQTHQIGGDEVAAWRIQQGKLNNGQTISYAAGLFIGKVNGFDEISHSGATAGYRAWLAYYPQKKLSIAILSNDASFDAGGAGGQIGEILLGQSKSSEKSTYRSVMLPAGELEKWEGIYKSARGYDVVSLKSLDKKILYNDQPLQVLHRDTLFLDGWHWITKGPNAIFLRSSDDTITYVRVQKPNLDDQSLNSLAGEYQSDDADVTFGVEIKGRDAWLVHKPFPAMKLTPSFRDGFLMEEFELVEFKRDKKGHVTGFDISTYRAEKVPFVKLEKRR